MDDDDTVLDYNTPADNDTIRNPNGLNLDPCQYQQMEYLTTKFWLIVVFGGTICVAGILANGILLNILLRALWKDSYCIYLASLAYVDLGILLTYLFVMCINILYDYTENVLLYKFWLKYVPYLFVLSRILTMIATYLVLTCSTERYLSVLRITNKFIIENLNGNKRRFIIGVVVLISVSFRLISFWEIEVVRLENCTGFAEFQLRQTRMARNKSYQKIYNLILVQSVQIFVPFVSLVIVNFLIISQWHEIVKKGSQNVFRKDSLYQRFGTSSKGLCTARRTMIALITSYLLCNFLNVLITIWEDLDKNYLAEHFEFYTFVADLVSLLTAFNSATRLPIYYACNWKVRKQVETFCAKYKIVDLKLNRQISTIHKTSEQLPLRCMNENEIGYNSASNCTKFTSTYSND